MRKQHDFDRFRSEMEELFADLCGVPRLVAQRHGFRPRVDVYRTDEPEALVVVAELPGVDPDQVDLSVAEGVLVIRGTRPRAVHGCATYRHMELDHGSFERRIPLSERVDADGIEAEYEQGLLRVTLPLLTERKAPRKVPVRARRDA
jgi:HSP20 family protein